MGFWDDMGYAGGFGSISPGGGKSQTAVDRLKAIQNAMAEEHATKTIKAIEENKAAFAAERSKRAMELIQGGFGRPPMPEAAKRLNQQAEDTDLMMLRAMAKAGLTGEQQKVNIGETPQLSRSHAPVGDMPDTRMAQRQEGFKRDFDYMAQRQAEMENQPGPIGPEDIAGDAQAAYEADQRRRKAMLAEAGPATDISRWQRF